MVKDGKTEQLAYHILGMQAFNCLKDYKAKLGEIELYYFFTVFYIRTGKRELSIPFAWYATHDSQASI